MIHWNRKCRWGITALPLRTYNYLLMSIFIKKEKGIYTLRPSTMSALSSTLSPYLFKTLSPSKLSNITSSHQALNYNITAANPPKAATMPPPSIFCAAPVATSGVLVGVELTLGVILTTGVTPPPPATAVCVTAGKSLGTVSAPVG